MSCITSRLLIVLSGGCQLSLGTLRGQGQSPAQLHGGLLDLAEADTDLGILNTRGHRAHFRRRLPRRTQDNVNVVAPLDHMKAPSDDGEQSQFGQRQGRVRQFKRQNNFNQNSFALAQQNQVPTFLGGQNFGNRPGRPGRPQGQRPNNLFVNNNQGFQRPNGGFRPQQQQFRPQQQQQQQLQQGFRQQQIQQSQGFFQPEPQTTVQQTSSPSTPAPVVRVSVSDISSSLAPASTTTTFSTRAPSPSFASSAVTSASLAPSTRQPRVLPVNNNFGSSGSSFGSSSGNSFGSSSGSFGSSSRNPFGQEPRGGRAGHGGDHGGNGYTAPEPDYHPPAEEYGHKPSYKILKLTGLDTAPLPNFNYMYSTENKINVMAEGELRNVCGEDVSVMRGSYDYYGPDGVKYTVDWYADETGFHPSAAHLPQPVEPNHPEVAAAVAAQLAAAADHHYKRYKRDTGYSAPPPCPPPEPTYEPAPLPSYSL